MILDAVCVALWGAGLAHIEAISFMQIAGETFTVLTYSETFTAEYEMARRDPCGGLTAEQCVALQEGPHRE